MKANRQRQRTPKPETLSFDWFTNLPVFHDLDNPLNNPRSSSGSTVMDLYRDILLLLPVENFVENFLLDDPRGCHSNLEEHQKSVENCAQAMKICGISHPQEFLELWTTSQILTGLDIMTCREQEGVSIANPGGWLWTYLRNLKGGR